MKILFLDDSHHRLVALMESLSGMKILDEVDIDYAPNVEVACDKLSNNSYEVIFLDHDLEDSHYCDPNSKEKTGQEVAKYIAANNVKSNYIIIHSWNPIGAKHMVDILSDYSTAYIPFNGITLAKIIHNILGIDIEGDQEI